MHERTRGQDKSSDLLKIMLHVQIFQFASWYQITTDGAPAMIGNKSGFDPLCEGVDDIPNILKTVWKIKLPIFIVARRLYFTNITYTDYI